MGSYKTSKHNLNPNNKLKDAAITWDAFYQGIAPYPYVFSPKDFANLKLLIRSCDTVKITLECFLNRIDSQWHLANASIPLFNSHFNKLLRIEAENSKYPDHYTKKYESTLEPQELAPYWQHLTKLGFKRTYSRGGGSTWTK